MDDSRAPASFFDMYVLIGAQMVGFVFCAIVGYIIFQASFDHTVETANPPPVSVAKVEQPARDDKHVSDTNLVNHRKKWSVSPGKQDALIPSYRPIDDIAGRLIPAAFEPFREEAPRPAPRLDTGRPLSRFFNALAALEAGTRDTPVTIVHLGDSHIASDSLTRGIRRRLQERFGNAGRGMMVPAGAYKYAYADGVSFKRIGSWQAANSLRSKSGPYGISGVRLTTRSHGAKLRLTAQGGPFDWGEATVVTGPSQGIVRLSAAGKTVEFNARADKRGSKVVRIEVRAESLDVIAGGNGATTVLNWAVGREGPGVRYINFGIAGATASITGRWARDLVARDIRHLNPDLIVWGYGTNEGFNDGLDLARYTRTVTGFLDFLRANAPRADLLIVGPADSARANGRRAATSLCRQNGAVSRWQSPPKLVAVRELLRDLARRQKAGFWDWQEAMGGKCSINAWAATSLAAGDRVHLTNRGYDRSAELFVDNLMSKFSLSRRVAATQQ